MKHFGLQKTSHAQKRKNLTFMILPEGAGGKIHTIKTPFWVIYALLGSIIAVTLSISGLSLINTYSQAQLERTLAEKEEILEEKTDAQREKERLEHDYSDQQSGFDQQIEQYQSQVIDLELRLIEMEKLAAQGYEKMNIKGSPISYAPTESPMGGIYLPLEDNTPPNQQLESLLTVVAEEFDAAEKRITQFSEDAAAFAAFQNAYPSLWPVSGIVTSEQGGRRDPINGGSANHTGIDIKVGIGTKVQAAAAGTVKSAGISSGYGYLAVIDHGNGYETYYAHNSRLLVSPGDQVQKGDIIALSGNSGRTTGPHVHYEVRYQGIVENPRDYLD